ncbi:MAG: CHASE domain-containing protein, partial [Rhodocyclaceae bacterium]|nr:CHASE domain-containing protein [Rhodocyclaceae bacterium]
IIKHLDNNAAVRDFTATSRAMGENLQRNIDFALHDLMAANAVFYNVELDPLEFHNFAKQLKRGNPLIRTYTWSPRVLDKDLARFERQAEKVLKRPFRVFDVDEHMRPIARKERAEYFPIFMAEPLEIRSVAGANLVSQPNRAAAIALARSTGRPQAAGMLNMMVGTPAIPIYWPVYANEYRQDSGVSDADDLRGFVSITIEVAKLTEATFKPYESGAMDIWLIDATGEEKAELIYGHAQRKTEALSAPDLELLKRKTHFISTHDVAGRNWLLVSRPAAEHNALQANGQFIGILLSGFGLTFALAIYMIGRQRSEDALRARDERLMSQNAILTQVARFGMAQGQDIEGHLRELIATSAGTLRVERVSLWLAEDNGKRLRCQILFTRSTGEFSSGMTIDAADVPNYFLALNEGRGFAADDAQNDPRTSEFTEHYLRPLGITSMLDVPVRIGGKSAGVVCHEHVGTPRTWAADEKNFAASIGDLASLVLESAGRQQAEKALQDSYQALERKVEDRTEELRKANERLRQLDQLKSMFIASMSHELRTPLNSIIGFTGVVLQGISGEVNDKQRDHLQRVYGSARHLLALITDVIDISKIEAGYADTYLETFSLNLLIEEAAATIQPQRIDKGLGIEIHAIEKIDVHTDRQRLLQAMLNLLSNAVKYSEHGTIHINLLEAGERIGIEVVDSGIGITPEAMSKLFQPFERIDTHLRIKTPGTGLGLYLTRKIMTDLLHGDIEAHSTPGKGSIFRLWIPHTLSIDSSGTHEGNV